MRKLSFTVTPEYDGRKLVCFIRGECGISSSLTATLRHTHEGILLNGMPSRTIDRVHTGDTVTVQIPDNSTAPLCFDFELDILFEDEDLLVLNKPAGISIHPTFNHPNGTLANAVTSYLIKKEENPGCARAIGRLDKGTSGVVVFAKNRFAAASLSETAEKRYLAISGKPLTGSGTVDAPIGRPFSDKTLRAVLESGEKAVTHWQAIQTFKDASLLSVTTETGRTHQIRVHMAHIGAPLIGDGMYGSPEHALISRPALHRSDLSFVHPVTGELVQFSAPLPEDMENLLKSLN